MFYRSANMNQIVIDTNILVAAFRSRNGASFRLMELMDKERFEINLSVPLVLEYEDVLLRDNNGIEDQDVRDLVDYLCKIGNQHRISFLWRPILNDPKDDMVLELAVAAQCGQIVTFNLKDFHESAKFGIQAIGPAEFLRRIGVIL